MNKWNWLKFLAVLVGHAAMSGEAAAQTLNDAGLWFAAFGNGKIETQEKDSPLRWWFDAHYRMLDDADGFNQSIIRPGLGYALNKDNALWTGYAWIRTSPIGDGEDVDENRLWQQWTYTPSVEQWSFLQRSRLEERWVETGNDIGLRWRHMARAQYKLTDTPQWSLIGWDEFFFHLNDTDWGARAGFDQNRAFVGVGFKRYPEAWGRLEVGYLNQFIDRRSGDSIMNHILSINLFF